MVQLSLLRQGNELAEASQQLAILEGRSRQPRFDACLTDNGLAPLHASGIEILQINLGKLCNQTCRHCHVDAGPDRREIMEQETVEACIDVVRSTGISLIDLTGGAPEMNPHFRRLVGEVRTMGRRVIDRCNLTILTAAGYEDLAEFLADHHVEITASLPCYLEENTDSQRGDGVFQKSIAALRKLNELGYGRPGSELTLSLVYNPVGPALPPDQQSLEAAYKRELRSRYGIEFNQLYTITNMPISRFLDDLLQQGKYEAYMQKLVEAFNPAAVEGVMCRSTLSVDWRGNLYDCDFNQMLELGVRPSLPQNIRDFDFGRLALRQIVTGRHCYGCTAGAGSSCQGSITS